MIINQKATQVWQGFTDTFLSTDTFVLGAGYPTVEHK